MQFLFLKLLHKPIHSSVESNIAGSEIELKYTIFLNDFFFKQFYLQDDHLHYLYSINYTYIVLATYTTDTYTYTNYAYTTLRYMYYNTININLIYGWRVYQVLVFS